MLSDSELQPLVTAVQSRSLASVLTSFLGITQELSVITEITAGNDSLAEKNIKSSMACQTNKATSSPAPLQMTPLPDSPWERLSAGSYGPLPSGQYLLVMIVIDCLQFPVLEIFYHLRACYVIPVFDMTLILPYSGFLWR